MNIKQYKFVTEYLRFSDKIVAYHNAYPHPTRNDRATESAANRLMQHPEVSKAISDAQETCMSQAMEDLKDQMKEELLTVHQKRLLCKHVVLGEVREEVVFKGKGCAHCSYFREIPYSVKLRYAKEDSLLAGHYPDKRVKKHNPSIETCNISQQPDNTSPLGRGVGAVSASGVMGTRDVHSHSTTTTPKNCNKLQQTDSSQQNHSLSKIQEIPVPNAFGNSSRQPHEKEPQRLSVSAVKNNSPKTCNNSQQPHTISHAGLRKLFNKQRSKNIKKRLQHAPKQHI